MKKILIFTLICALAVGVLASCGDVTVETMTIAETTTAKTVHTMDTTAEVTTQTETEGTTRETSTETTSTEIEMVIEDTYETLPDMFVELMEFSKDRGYFYGKSDIRKTAGLPDGYVGVHYRVIGYDETYVGKYGSRWFVEVIEVYGEERYEGIGPIDYNRVHTMVIRGHLDSYLWERPIPAIGEDYFRYIPWEEFRDGAWWMALVFDIEEIDGKQYLYGYGIDMSVYDCAIEITDEKENQIYKEGRNDKIIAYLKSIDHELPTFDYKCELFAWLYEVGILEE